jgi:hypothetical protein
MGIVDRILCPVFYYSWGSGSRTLLDLQSVLNAGDWLNKIVTAIVTFFLNRSEKK